MDRPSLPPPGDLLTTLRRTPTADGAKAVIAGQPVRLTGFDGQYGAEFLGSTWGQLHRR